MANITDDEIVELDRLVQSKNICFICSAGNIEVKDILSCINNGQAYPSYLSDFPVLPPANGPAIIGVGSLSKSNDQKNPKSSNAPY